MIFFNLELVFHFKLFFVIWIFFIFQIFDEIWTYTGVPEPPRAPRPRSRVTIVHDGPPRTRDDLNIEPTQMAAVFSH